MACMTCMSPTCKAPSPHVVGHMRQELSHECDGPITPFVLICRAITLAHDGTLTGEYAKDDIIANALHEELSARGWIVADEDVGIVEVSS